MQGYTNVVRDLPPSPPDAMHFTRGGPRYDPVDGRWRNPWEIVEQLREGTCDWVERNVQPCAPDCSAPNATYYGFYTNEHGECSGVLGLIRSHPENAECRSQVPHSTVRRRRLRGGL